MNAEIPAVGSELLLGQIADTNSAWTAQRPADQGVNLFYEPVSTAAGIISPAQDSPTAPARPSTP